MKKTILAISMLVIISFSTFLGIKAYKSTNISSLLNANLEALSWTEYIFIPRGTGICGICYFAPPGSVYQVHVRCKISPAEVKDWSNDYTSYINWCCESCPSSTYCSTD